MLGRFAFDVRYTWFRNWVNAPTGQRLGLVATLPETPVSLRALRRTLAIELAYRPGRVLAAKLHLKHSAMATTGGGGYASRPGGARAKLLAKVNKHETEHNLELIWTEIRNLQQGIMPAGPGARALTDFSPPPTSGPANDARSPCSTSCRGCGYPRSSPLRSAPPKSRSPSPTR